MAGIEQLIQYSQLLQAGGKVASGIGENNAAKYNANILNMQAGQVAANAGMEEAKLRREQRQEIGRQVATAAGSGLTQSGSIVDVMRQNIENQEMDALTLRYRGAIEGAGLKAQAKMTKYEGKQALYGGIAGAGSKLLASFGEDARRARKPSTSGYGID
jgi:hypothetical protein